MDAQPPDGEYNEEWIAAAFVYAEMLDAAAALAPPEHQPMIERIADFNRSVATDPTAPGTAEEAGEIFATIGSLAFYVMDTCGIDIFA